MKVMIPSENIHSDKNGNVVIGKNLEIDGTTKLNGGLKAIHEYTFTDDGDTCKLGVFFETNISDLGDDNAYNFIGYITNSYGDKQYYLKVRSEYSLFLCVFLLFHNEVDRNCLISLYNELLYVAQQCGEVVQKDLIDSVLKYLNATIKGEA